MHVAAGGDARGQQAHQRRLDQAALVVALLVPRVGEEDVHAVQAGGRDHVLQHLHGVVLDDAQVGQLLLADGLEQRAHAGFMHLAADEQRVGHQRRDVRRGVAHAEADLEHGF